MKKQHNTSEGRGLFSREHLGRRNPFITRKSILIGVIASSILMTYTACKKETDFVQHEDEMSMDDLEVDSKAFGQVFQPTSGNNCNTSTPAAPPTGVGSSAKQNWHRVVTNQTQFINAINYVNANGGTIYIDASFALNTTLPTITRSNVTILSNSSKVISDNVVGGSSATAMLNVTGSNFKMQNVTIQGAGRTNPNSFSWAGKRSAVSVSAGGSQFLRVKIQYFSHAAIRIENGSGHLVDQCILMDQKQSTLGYGVLLRNNANNVTVKRSRFARNSHSVATTGGGNQSYKAIGNYTLSAYKWHFDAHMAPDGWAGSKMEVINNVSGGNAALVVVRGPFKNGIFIKNNLYNQGAGDLAKLKPDATFTQSGNTYVGGNFYSPFGGSASDQQKAKTYFQKGEITGNCVWQ